MVVHSGKQLEDTCLQVEGGVGYKTLKCVRRFPAGFREVSILIGLEYMLKWIRWRYQCASKDKGKEKSQLTESQLRKSGKISWKKRLLRSSSEEEQNFKRQRWP